MLFHPKTAPGMISEGLKFSGQGGMPPHSSSECVYMLYNALPSIANTGTPVFKILDPPLLSGGLDCVQLVSLLYPHQLPFWTSFLQLASVTNIPLSDV